MIDIGVGKENTMKRFGHVEKMLSEEFVKVYKSELEGPNRRGRLLGRWYNRVQGYPGEKGINGRGVLEKQRGNVGIEKDGDSSAVTIPKETFLEGVRHKSYRQIDGHKILVRSLIFSS